MTAASWPFEITPLERWISEKTGVAGPPELERLQEYQLEKLRGTLRLVQTKSRFYMARLGAFPPEEMTCLDDLQRLPFTSASDIASCPEDFLCVSPRDISRIVTLSTSGTTGQPKRVFFTADDQELTVDFFHRGMTTMAAPGDRVMIFMPGSLPGSIGDLLSKGLSRFDCAPVVYGPIRDFADAYDALLREKIDVLVGIPSQILRLARTPASKKPALKSVLLSADTVPAAVARAVGDAWNCPVFGHYGMTETGLGGGVECAARDGYHLREADLLFEIVDPESGLPVPDGEYGEVVFTTLTRRGMPLLRYRTGDRSRFMTAPCPCGSVLRRLERVSGRLGDAAALQGGRTISIAALDELVYADPSVLAYSAVLTSENGADRLILTIETAGNHDIAAFDKGPLHDKIDALAQGLVTKGCLLLDIRPGTVGFFTSGTLKRRLDDRRVRQP